MILKTRIHSRALLVEPAEDQDEYIWKNCEPEQKWNLRHLKSSAKLLVQAFEMQRQKLLQFDDGFCSQPIFSGKYIWRPNSNTVLASVTQV
jgi:hypothetical protein